MERHFFGRGRWGSLDGPELLHILLVDRYLSLLRLMCWAAGPDGRIVLHTLPAGVSMALFRISAFMATSPYRKSRLVVKGSYSSSA